jgi:hypothetical protein
VSRRLALMALAVALGAQPATAQYSLGGGVDWLSYSFKDGLGVESAQLMMFPAALRLPVGAGLTFDIYSAWAEGRVETNGNQLTLSGPVDTSVKASYQATPWALVSVGVNVPTGKAGHNAEEAAVASVLATDLLGFGEASWGTGFAVTSSVATAVAAGGFGLGVAGAYSVRGEFEPEDGSPVRYKPGSETRVRVGIDRNFGTSTLTLGGTFMNYAADQEDGVNLFQAGHRLRFDASFAFRAGDGVWTLYAADVIRENGDLTLDLVDGVGTIVGDTTIVTAKQNMIQGGLVGTLGLGGGFMFRPHFDFRYQMREEDDGNEAGTGWMFGAGGDLPFRLFGGTELFPKARVFFGSIRDSSGVDIGVVGLELKGTIRWIF